MLEIVKNCLCKEFNIESWHVFLFLAFSIFHGSISPNPFAFWKWSVSKGVDAFAVIENGEFCAMVALRVLHLDREFRRKGRCAIHFNVFACSTALASKQWYTNAPIPIVFIVILLHSFMLHTLVLFVLEEHMKICFLNDMNSKAYALLDVLSSYVLGLWCDGLNLHASCVYAICVYVQLNWIEWWRWLENEWKTRQPKLQCTIFW